jgi:hypothetical protein
MVPVRPGCAGPGNDPAGACPRHSRARAMRAQQYRGDGGGRLTRARQGRRPAAGIGGLAGSYARARAGSVIGGRQPPAGPSHCGAVIGGHQARHPAVIEYDSGLGSGSAAGPGGADSGRAGVLVATDRRAAGRPSPGGLGHHGRPPGPGSGSPRCRRVRRPRRPRRATTGVGPCGRLRRHPDEGRITPYHP